MKSILSLILSAFFLLTLQAQYQLDFNIEQKNEMPLLQINGQLHHAALKGIDFSLAVRNQNTEEILQEWQYLSFDIELNDNTDETNYYYWDCRYDPKFQLNLTEIEKTLDSYGFGQFTMERLISGGIRVVIDNSDAQQSPAIGPYQFGSSIETVIIQGMAENPLVQTYDNSPTGTVMTFAQNRGVMAAVPDTQPTVNTNTLSCRDYELCGEVVLRISNIEFQAADEVVHLNDKIINKSFGACHGADDENQYRSAIKEATNNITSKPYFFPNPAKGQSNLFYDDMLGINILSVYSLDGQLLKEISLQQMGNRIDLSDLQSGLYLVYLGTDTSFALEPIKLFVQ